MHHGGNRVPADLNGMTPVCPSDDPETGTTRFLALGGGRPGLAEVVRGAGEIELRYERYALRRRGEVPR